VSAAGVVVLAVIVVAAAAAFVNYASRGFVRRKR
jgi:hypothetical protein